MQTRVHSTLEAFVDLLCSIVVNVVGQVVIYSKAATTNRITVFSSLFLTLMFFRRLAMRRFFEHLTPPGTRQSHAHSIVEVVSDTVVGFSAAMILQLMIYGEAATFVRASLFTLAMYGLTIARRYGLRRLFAALAMRTAASSAVLTPPQSEV